VEGSGRRPKRSRAASRGTPGDGLAALLVEVAALGPGAFAGHVGSVARALVGSIGGPRPAEIAGSAVVVRSVALRPSSIVAHVEAARWSVGWLAGSFVT
jgi:hypothetical protein